MSDTAGSRNDGTVDRLLREAGFDDDAALRSALLDLQGLAAGQPQASAAVAALMAHPAEQAVQDDRAAQSTATTRLAAVPDAASSPQPEAGDPAALDRAAPAPAAAQPAPGSPAAVPDELAARRRAKRRITLTTLSLAASLAAGGAVAVASDQGIRDSFDQLHHAVTSFVATAGGPAPVPVQTPAPVPAQPGSPSSVPATPASTAPATAAPETGNSQAPKHTPTPTHPATVPLPDLPVPENVTPGVPGGPLNGEGQPPTLPLPATPPVLGPSIHP